MKKVFTLFLIISLQLAVFSCFSQDSEISDAVKEGYLLYKLEYASWTSTDTLFIKYPQYKSRGGGYLSYEVSDTVKTIVWDKENSNKILVTFNFT